MNTYTVINPSSGEMIDTGLSAAEAAHIVLTDDGREYEIREASDGKGFELWSRQPVANKGWTQTVVFSLADDRAIAEDEIFLEVINANWRHHPEVITDAHYAAMLAENEAE